MHLVGHGDGDRSRRTTFEGGSDPGCGCSGAGARPAHNRGSAHHQELSRIAIIHHCDIVETGNESARSTTAPDPPRGLPRHPGCRSAYGSASPRVALSKPTARGVPIARRSGVPFPCRLTKPHYLWRAVDEDGTVGIRRGAPSSRRGHAPPGACGKFGLDRIISAG